jgi:hypothetical protein
MSGRREGGFCACVPDAAASRGRPRLERDIRGEGQARDAESHKRDLRGKQRLERSGGWPSAQAPRPAHGRGAMCGRTGRPARASPPPAPGPRPRASSARPGCRRAWRARVRGGVPGPRPRSRGRKDPDARWQSRSCRPRHGKARPPPSARGRGGSIWQGADRAVHPRASGWARRGPRQGVQQGGFGDAAPVEEDARQRQVKLPRGGLGGQRLGLGHRAVLDQGPREDGVRRCAVRPNGEGSGRGETQLRCDATARPDAANGTSRGGRAEALACRSIWSPSMSRYNHKLCAGTLGGVVNGDVNERAARRSACLSGVYPGAARGWRR